MPRKTKDSKKDEKITELKDIKKSNVSNKKDVDTLKKEKKPSLKNDLLKTLKKIKNDTSKKENISSEKEPKKDTKKTSSRKTSGKETVVKKNTVKKPAVTETTVSNSTVKNSTVKKTTVKSSSAKNASVKNSPVKKTTVKNPSVKKTTVKSPSVKKTSVKRTSTVAKSKQTVSNAKVDVVEYYDLPYRYNQTIVKLLAQTPNTLFIYWDISDDDRANYIKEYGENFFEITKPVLKIYNETLNYSFEVEINDFANSWYLHVNDSKCNYKVELGRRLKEFNTQAPINNQTPIKEYIYISQSNKIESPNDKILFNKEQKMVYFKDVKTNTTTSKSVANISFIRNMGKIYNIYDLYKQIYKDEDFETIFDLSNPSSPINFKNL